AVPETLPSPTGEKDCSNCFWARTALAAAKLMRSAASETVIGRMGLSPGSFPARGDLPAAGLGGRVKNPPPSLPGERGGGGKPLATGRLGLDRHEPDRLGGHDAPVPPVPNTHVAFRVVDGAGEVVGGRRRTVV